MRSNSYQESSVPIVVKIALPNGFIKHYIVYSVTDWHAIDQAYAKHCQLQPDRSCYNSDPNTLRCN